MDTGALTPVEETAMATLFARAFDSRSRHPVLGDALAGDIVGGIDFDFAGLGVTSSVAGLVALRTKVLDERIRRFVDEHPDAVVVDLGAGLDAAMARVGPPPTVDWYSVDLPAVIALRTAMLPDGARSHAVAASVTGLQWLDVIPAHRPAMVFADGLFPFLTEPVVVSLLRRITEHFPAGIVAFNDYGRVSRLNRYAKMVTARKRMFRTMYSQWAFRGFTNAHAPESWAPRLRLLEEVSAFDRPETALCSPPLRLAGHLAPHVPALARSTRVLSYAF